VEQRHGHILRERKVNYKQSRRIVGRTWSDIIRNTYIRGELKMEEIQNLVERSRLRWFGQVKGMDEHRILKRKLEMKMSGRRPRGRPQT
jgi:hypothetical protein